MPRWSLSTCLGALLLFPAQQATADACRELLVQQMMKSQSNLASKSLLTTVTGGQKPMINYHFSNGAGDWMTQVVEPATIPWSLSVGSILYASSDKGKSWKKVREMNDPGHDRQVILKQQEEAARAAKKLLCSFEEIGGVRHDKLDAELSYPQMSMTTDITLWVHPETRRTVKSHSVMRMSGMVTAVTQTIEYVPEVTLPKP